MLLLMMEVVAVVMVVVVVVFTRQDLRPQVSLQSLLLTFLMMCMTPIPTWKLM
jgi:hypothetical protein